MARTIGKTWKSLDDAARQVYINMALKEKEDYKIAIKEYEEQKKEIEQAAQLSPVSALEMNHNQPGLQNFEARGIAEVAKKLAPSEVAAIISIFR